MLMLRAWRRFGCGRIASKWDKWHAYEATRSGKSFHSGSFSIWPWARMNIKQCTKWWCWLPLRIPLRLYNCIVCKLRDEYYLRCTQCRARITTVPTKLCVRKFHVTHQSKLLVEYFSMFSFNSTSTVADVRCMCASACVCVYIWFCIGVVQLMQANLFNSFNNQASILSMQHISHPLP